MNTDKKKSCLGLICSAVNLQYGLFVENGEFRIPHSLLCLTFLVYLLHDIRFMKLPLETNFMSRMMLLCYPYLFFRGGIHLDCALKGFWTASVIKTGHILELVENTKYAKNHIH